MSRLEKIFILLETGSSSQTRKLAATQIGEVEDQGEGGASDWRVSRRKGYSLERW